MSTELQVALTRDRHRMEKELIAAEQAPDAAQALGEAIGTLLAQ